MAKMTESEKGNQTRGCDTSKRISEGPHFAERASESDVLDDLPCLFVTSNDELL
jgi:hypothetical protein